MALPLELTSPTKNDTPSNPIVFTNVYFCRRSDIGYLIVEVDPTNALENNGDEIPAVGFGAMFARFNGERIYRHKDLVYNYTESIKGMTNSLKNGFEPATETAERIFASFDGLGFRDFFKGSVPNLAANTNTVEIDLSLHKEPAIECRAVLELSLGNPKRLDVLFQDLKGDTIGYHYSYSNSGNIGESGFDTIGLVVSNYVTHVSRFQKKVRILSKGSDRPFNKREHFGFAVQFPQKSVWKWNGDVIEGMRELKIGDPAPQAKGIVKLGILLILVAPLIYLLVRRVGSKKNPQ